MTESHQATASVADTAPRSPTPHETWSKPNANIRLTERRRKLLLAFLDELDDGATPYDAIDHCIAIATASRSLPPREQASIDMLDESLKAAECGLYRRADIHEGKLDSMSANVEKLVELMSAMACMPGFGGDGFDGQAMLISDWLNQEASAFGASSILASARWNGSAREGQSVMSMELMVERKAVGGYKGPERNAAASMVKVDGIAESNPLPRCLPMREFYLACSRLADGGWAISAHEVAPDGGIGAPLGSTRQA
jgi:hypothetical protein